MDKTALPIPVARRGPPEGVSITLWTALLEDLAYGSDGFIEAVTEQLRESVLSGEELAQWRAMLKSLRQYLMPGMSDREMLGRLEDCLHQAEQVVLEAERRLTGSVEKRDSPGRTQQRPLFGAPTPPPPSATDLAQGIVSRLQQAPDTESVLRIALEELGTLLGAQVAVARLGTREQLMNAELDSDES